MVTITLRENTEWVETIKDGWNLLGGADREMIVRMVSEFEPESEQRNVFGSGDASKKITKLIEGLQ